MRQVTAISSSCQLSSRREEAATIRLGIVGAGVMGQRLSRQVATRRDVELRAVCDVASDNSAAILGDVRRHTCVADLLSAEDLDLIYVATPPTHHRDIVVAAVRAGVHVLCEKPLAVRLDEAEEMAAAALAAGVVNAVNLPLHHAASTKAILRWLDGGALGELRAAHLDLTFPDWPRLWQRSDWVGGRDQGGPVREVGTHFFHLLMRAFGPVSRVWSSMDYPSAEGACERAATGALQLTSGSVVSVHVATGVAHPERVRLRAYGTEGTVGLNGWRGSVAGHISDACGAAPMEVMPLKPSAADESTALDEVVRAICGEPADLADFRAGVEVQRVLDAWERSAASGAWAEVR
jgi:predicted dehydrogenase